MIYRLQNDGLGRSLHDTIYKRLMAFCEKYTPEFPCEAIVQSWLRRAYDNDANLHIIMNITPSGINRHVVIDVQESFGVTAVHCYQVEHDYSDLEEFDLGLKYIDNLVLAHNAIGCTIYAHEHVKAFEQKYKFKSQGTMMFRSRDAILSQDQEDVETLAQLEAVT